MSSANRIALVALTAGTCLLPAPRARAFLDFVEVQRDGVLGVEELDGAIAVAVSPDGLHVYAAGEVDDAIAAFSRDAATGALTRVGFARDGVGGVDGLDQVNDLALSSDGRHLFAAGPLDGAVAVFARDTATGTLAFVETETGLGTVEAVVASPDGRHVYAVAYSGVVSLFSRNVATGALTFVDDWQDGVGGVEGTNGALDVAVSRNGDSVYVAGSLDGAIAVFSRASGSGALTFVEAESAGLSGIARSVRVAPDGSQVFAVGYESLTAFARDAADGALTFERALSASSGSGFAGAYGVAVSLDGGALYVAGSNDDAVVAVSRNLGYTTEPGLVQFLEARLDGIDGFDGLDGAVAVDVSPDGRHVYVAAHDEDALGVLAAPALRPLAEITLDQGLPGLLGPTSVVVDPVGRGAFVAGTAADSLNAFSRHPFSSILSFVEREIDGVGASGLDGVASVALAGSTHLYVASSVDDAVGVWSIEPETRSVVFVEQHVDGFLGVDGLDGASSIAVSPDGRHVYAGSTTDGAIAHFTRSVADGSLAFEDAIEAGAEVSALAPSPDGAQLYVSSPDRVTVFERDPATGSLAFVDEEIDGATGGHLLGGAGRAAVSRDGAHVYVPAVLDDAVMIFERAAGTGALTAVDAVVQGFGGVTGLGGAADVALTPDGARLFVASIESAAVALFDRNFATGALTFVASADDGEPGYASLNGAISLAVTGGGMQVVVAARDDDAVTVLTIPEAAGAATTFAALVGLTLVAGSSRDAGGRRIARRAGPCESTTSTQPDCSDLSS